jgi:predicted ATPase
VLVDGIDISPAHYKPTRWPFTIPAIREIAEHGLRIRSNIVVLMGANGSGKSTLLEAIAESYGLDVRGGHGARRYGRPDNTRSPLGEALILSRTLTGHRFTGHRKAKGFFLRAETAAGMLEFMTSAGVGGYGERPASQVSHGESYLQAVQGRFTGPGLYLLDEAEGPLSFQSTLALLYRLVDLARSDGVQIVYATHSPLVAAMPNAQILELTDGGVEDRAWEELELVELWRAFLSRPERFFE